MTKRYSTKKLSLTLQLFFWTISRQDLKQMGQNYIRTVNRDVYRFRLKLIKQNLFEEKEITRLTNLFSTAVYFRANKKFRKELADIVKRLPLLLSVILVPYCTVKIRSVNETSVWYFILIYISGYLTFGTFIFVFDKIFRFIDHFRVKIGKAYTELIAYCLIAGLAFLFYYIYQLETNVLNFSIMISIALLYVTLAIFIFSYLIKVFIDFRFYSKKILITDALIIESCYQLSRRNWKNAVKRRINRQNAINEIERLAVLIENDWSLHINGRDEKNNHWKNKTLEGISEGLRSIKRDIMIPSINTPAELKEKFESIFQKILLHDIVGLIGAEVPAIRIRKKSILKSFKSTLVAVIPLIVCVTFKIYSVKEIPENYVNSGLIISGLWFMISLLISLDPNLAHKLSTIKSSKELFKSNLEDEK